VSLHVTLALLHVVVFVAMVVVVNALRLGRGTTSWWGLPLALTLSLSATLLGLLCAAALVVHAWSAALARSEAKLGLSQAVITTTVQSPGAL
jgi:hypothetical protein